MEYETSPHVSTSLGLVKTKSQLQFICITAMMYAVAVEE